MRDEPETAEASANQVPKGKEDYLKDLMDLRGNGDEKTKDGAEPVSLDEVNPVDTRSEFGFAAFYGEVRVTASSGKSLVLEKGHKEFLRLTVGDRVSAGPGSGAFIIGPAGGISLASSTDIQISTLAKGGHSGETSLWQDSGEVLADIRPGSSFQVLTTLAVSRGAGTKFKSLFDAGKKVNAIAVLEGEVVVAPIDPGLEPVVVGAGGKARVTETGVTKSGNVSFLAQAGKDRQWTGAQNLTGSWTTDSGAQHCIRHVGDQVSWYADARPKAHNVFSGTVENGSIEGRWVDLPGGEVRDSGELSLRIETSQRLVKKHSSVPYKSSVWTRAKEDFCAQTEEEPKATGWDPAGPTPYLSFGQDWLTIDQATCMSRAVVAFAAAQLDPLGETTSWHMMARLSYFNAAITCNELSGQSLATVMVAGPVGKSEPTDNIKNFLRDFMLNRPPGGAGMDVAATCEPDGLGLKWAENEYKAGGAWIWEGKWDRVQDTNNFKAVFSITNSDGKGRNFDLIVTRENDSITVKRYPPGQTGAGMQPSCEYEGTVQEDGVRIAGTYSCVGSPEGPELVWEAVMECGRPDTETIVAAYAKLKKLDVEQDLLGVRWEEKEFLSGGKWLWRGVWTRRGTSNVFDAVWTRTGRAVRGALTVTLDGNKVSIDRKTLGGATCAYNGVLAPDRETVTGTYECGGLGPLQWTGTIKHESKG